MDTTTQIPPPSQKFSNLQLELLRLYARDITEDELIEVKDMMARYFAEKAIKKMSEWTERNKVDDETLEKWLNEQT